MIGIFDSGIGGLGTTSALRKKAPMADLVYFGDLANMPYGPRPNEELFQLTLGAMKFLQSKGATEYIAACNSVSVSVIAPIAEVFGESAIKIIEMVGPAAKALHDRKTGKILVVATLATVRSKMYERAFSRQGLSVEMLALPNLASAIEQKSSVVELKKIIAPAIVKAIEIEAQTLVFGCTQYPFIRDVFKQAFVEKEYPIELFDPSDAVAKEAMARFSLQGSGVTKVFVSQPSEVFNETVRNLLGPSVLVELVDKKGN